MSKQEKSEVIHHFDAWSAHYEKEVWVRDKYFHRLIKKQVLNAISNTIGQEILELGVGSGIYLDQLIQKGHFVTGADISIEMIKVSKKKLKRKGHNIFNLVLCDAEFLPFRNSIFDVISCIEVLRHLPTPYKTLWTVFRESLRILTKDGSLLITVPNILRDKTSLFSFALTTSHLFSSARSR